MTIASFFNPISPNLILLSGAGASFGLNSGLLLLPAMIARHARSQPTIALQVPFSPFWLALAAILSVAFVAVLGPGIHFSK